MSVQIQEQKQSLWDTPLTVLFKINWDVVILVAILLIAAVTRFSYLEYGAWSHDEAIHTSWSNDLYSGKGYIHNPIYHGPLLYHATAFTFFLLGDNDFSARVMPVLFGLVLIAAPFLFREWLGKRGWVVTSLMFLISPVIAHYSRVQRHDIYVEVCVVLIALAIMKYLTTRHANWLYFGAAMLALSFTAMETTFIFMALFGYFLAGAFTFDYFNTRAPDSKWLSLGIATVFGLPFAVVAIVWYLYDKYVGSKSGAQEEGVEKKVSDFDNAAFDLLLVLGSFLLPLGATPLFIKYILQRDPTDYNSVLSISASAGVLLFFIALSAAVGLLWNWRKWAICAALFYPIMLVLFTTVFTNPAGIGSGFVGSLGYWISQQTVQRGSQPPYYYLMVTMPLYEYLPYLFGMTGLFYILARRSWVRAGIFGVVLLVLLAIWSYIEFTPGVLEWMSANLPLFLGKDNLQAGNWAVLIVLGWLMPLFFALSYNPDDKTTRFPTLIGVWALGVLILFSWAGEKMPWLNMHIAIPLSFVAGYFMNDVLNLNWREVLKRGGLIMALVFALGLLVLAFQFFFGPAPLSGTPLDEQARMASVIIAIVIVGACAGVVVYFALSLGTKTALRILTTTLFIIFALFTIRTMASAAYYNKDMATETIVYAQGTPDVPNAMREIDELSRRLCSQTNTDPKSKLNCNNGMIKVAYDDDSSWPFVWYLRDYNSQFYGKTPGGPFDAEVVIVGDANESAVKPFLGNRYIKRQMRLVWWPDESYKDLNWAKLFGGTDENGNPIPGALQPDNFKKIVRDIWFFRKYEHNLNSWPFVHRFSLYVRKDVASLLWQYAGIAPTAAVDEPDPYLEKYIQNLQAKAVVNGANGDFDGPKNVALAPDGSFYVLDTNKHRVQQFDAARNFVREWGSQGAEPGQFNEPWGIAVGKDGTVYVADTWNHRIEKFDKDGNFLAQWGVFGDIGTAWDENLLQLYGPRAIAIDADGNLWVADTGNERIIQFDPQGEPLDVFGGVGGEPGQFLEPVGITIDAPGNFYIADTWNNRIQVFDADFEPVRQIDVQAWDSQSVVNKPYIAVDAEGNIYVTDPEGFRIIKFGSDGKVRAVWGFAGSDLGGMQLPTGIAVNAEGEIFIADSGNNRVLIFDAVKQ